MQIPQYWAEARAVGKVGRRDRVVRRFGWSERSQDDAQRQAEQRARAALAELQEGRAVAPREAKRPYGEQGLPIREQVLVRRGELVVTRNSYGAHCLNEPDVLFADVDTELRLPRLLERMFRFATRDLLWMAAISGFALLIDRRVGACFGTLAIGLVAFGIVDGWRQRLLRLPRLRERARQQALAQFHRVIAGLPEARFACYETPAGWRLLALHRRFDPTAADTQRLLRALDTDPAYRQMCELQACFRARVSGKPWRMGVRHIVPRPGVWPVHPDRLARREAWIAEYEAVAANFAACRFVAEIGAGAVDPRCAEVQRVHDEMSRARSDLPLA